MVLNIVEEFIMQDNSDVPLGSNEELYELNAPALASGISKITVAKLVEDYLIEIAKDPNLPLSKFFDLAEILPSDSRPVHDGLYHAIDTYLKQEHPGLSKSEKKKLCGLMNCKKLSGDACAHAMQNERLPLRLVVQILYFQMRASAATTSRAESGNSYGSSRSAITTNTEDECDGVLNAEDGKAQKFTKLSEGRKGCEWSSGGNNENRSNGQGKSGSSKVKDVVMPKKMLGKFLSSKGQAGESSNSSDTSGSPNSAKQEQPNYVENKTINNKSQASEAMRISNSARPPAGESAAETRSRPLNPKTMEHLPPHSQAVTRPSPFVEHLKLLGRVTEPPVSLIYSPTFHTPTFAP
ncbi:hypothetical protein B296_00052169 [Ensete ventricosum]|uniref:NPH3 domain-containing protein n=1 Tax=Ensete ventricosum TaxID=4639 RepID=A0A426XQA2_ENSVE|nr:hypothetical protein B296_00052169 [Ensete ventricosum]